MCCCVCTIVKKFHGALARPVLALGRPLLDGVAAGRIRHPRSLLGSGVERVGAAACLVTLSLK